MKESAKAFVNKAADELQKIFESIGESITAGLNSAMQWCGEHLKVMEEWDLLNNTLDPDTLGTKSSSIAYFKCSECNKIYSSMIKTKILNDKRHIKSCSFCKGYRTKKIHCF